MKKDVEYLSKKHIEQCLNQDRIFHTSYSVTQSVEHNRLNEDLALNDCLSIDIIVEGSGVHCVNGENFPCKVGDIYITSPGVCHNYFLLEANGALTVKSLMLKLEDWFRGDVVAKGNKRYCYGVFGDGANVAYAMLNTNYLEKIDSIFEDIEYEILGKDEEWQAAIRSSLTQLLVFVGRYINLSIKNDMSKAKEWNTVSSVLDIIDDEFCDCELSLESIAKRVYMSPSHLSRAFKVCVGQLFSEYLREVRLTYASKLLKESDMTIERIVEECGLRNVPTFYRNFREIFGMTPQIYRRLGNSSLDETSITNKTEESEKKVIMEILNEISLNVQNGRSKLITEIVQRALDEGISANDILDNGLLAGMSVIGEKFKNNQVFVPQVLVAAKAMNIGIQLLKPYLISDNSKISGRVCIGTVQGDLHDIGKNLVKLMMEGKGLEVIDLGTDVSPETFVKTAIEQNCQIICCSALLTTTIGVMEDVIKAAEAAGIRDKVKIMVGGAPVNEEFASKIGADCYTVDAASAADAAVALCEN